MSFPQILPDPICNHKCPIRMSAPAGQTGRGQGAGTAEGVGPRGSCWRPDCAGLPQTPTSSSTAGGRALEVAPKCLQTTAAQTTTRTSSCPVLTHGLVGGPTAQLPRVKANPGHLCQNPPKNKAGHPSCGRPAVGTVRGDWQAGLTPASHCETCRMS